MATIKIDAIPTVTASVGDKYVIFDASTGDVGCVAAIVPMQGASTATAGVTGTVPAPSAGSANRVLKADATWGESASASSSTPAQTMEYGCVRNANGAWSTNSLVLGGMQFQWSQAAINGGGLNFVKAAGFTQIEIPCGQTARKYENNTYTGDTSENLNMFSSTVQTAAPTLGITGVYQQIDYEFFTRNAAGATSNWSIKVISDGGNGLVMSGTFVGQRYT